MTEPMSDDSTLDADEYYDIEALVRNHLALGEVVDEMTVVRYLRWAANAIEKEYKARPGV